MLIISRVRIVSMILPVVLSTVSNLLVGQFSLVEFVLILLFFRPLSLLWMKINVHVSELLPLLRVVPGKLVVVHTGSTESKSSGFSRQSKDCSSSRSTSKSTTPSSCAIVGGSGLSSAGASHSQKRRLRQRRISTPSSCTTVGGGTLA